MDFIVSDAEKNAIFEEIEQSEAVGEGLNTTAYRSSRGYIVKPAKYEPMKFDQLEENDRLSGLYGLPETEVEIVDLTDYGLWKHTALIRQRESDMTHEEAILNYGAEKTVEMASWTWTLLREQGIRYRDFKTENIHFFREGSVYVPKPIDFLDKDAYEVIGDLEIIPSKAAEAFDLYINGNDRAEGITDQTNLSPEEAIEATIWASSLMNDIDVTGEPLYDIQRSIEK